MWLISISKLKALETCAFIVSDDHVYLTECCFISQSVKVDASCYVVTSTFVVLEDLVSLT